MEAIGVATGENLRDAGFHERRDMGLGRFLERPGMERRLPGYWGASAGCGVIVIWTMWGGEG